jgi:protein translocase SecG subunit
MVLLYQHFPFYPNHATMAGMTTITHALPWIQLILSLLLILSVLLQRSADGIEGLGGSSSNMTYFTRRGAERFLFIATIVIAVLFAASAFLALVLK